MHWRHNKRLIAKKKRQHCKKMDQMQGDYITVIYFYKQYHSPRCWRTLDDADNNYKKMGSEGKRLKGKKEQTLMRLLGLGWNKAYHA